MIQRPSFLNYRSYRYLKAASLFMALSLFCYWLTRPASGGSYGGTWYGYASGIASALLVVLLAWYGIRKRRTPRILDRRNANRRVQADASGADGAEKRKLNRRFRTPEQTWRYGGTVQGWLSAHVYLGTALMLLSSLHTGWRLGWNIHTLPYVLLLLVTASGFYGAHAYLTYPRRITENIGNESLEGLLRKIAELDDLARLRAVGLPDEAIELISRARQSTRLGGTFLQQISGGQRDCPTAFAVQRMRELGKELIDGDQPRLMRDLYSVLLQKQRMVERARNEIALNARMQFWLYLHVPLSIALFAALFGHVATILVYW